MAVDLYTNTKFVAGGVAVNSGGTEVFTSGADITYTLPGGAPTGFSFFAVFTDGLANTATIAAVAGETVGGTTASAADNDIFMFVKTGATTWVSKIVG